MTTPAQATSPTPIWDELASLGSTPPPGEELPTDLATLNDPIGEIEQLRKRVAELEELLDEVVGEWFQEQDWYRPNFDALMERARRMTNGT